MNDDDDLTAAELAFGLLDPADALAAEQRVESDATFARAYARWLGHAAAMAVGGAGELPRPSLWAELVARLPANDNPSLVPARDRTVRWWQGGTAIAASLALVFGVVALERPPLPVPVVAPAAAPAPPLVAMLSAKSGDGLVTVSFDPGSGRLMSAPHGDMPLGDRVPELWVIPADGKPRSLGVIAAGAPGWMRASGAGMPMVAPGATLAISVEPKGGSPTGLPTGPVIMSGTVTTT